MYGNIDDVLLSSGSGASGTDLNELILNLWGNDTIHAGGGSDVILDALWGNVTADGGSGYDVLLLGRGADTAVFNIAENADNTGTNAFCQANDFYHGGSGCDTLEIDITGANLSQADVDAMIALFNDNVGGKVDFSDLGFDLVAKSFEKLVITGDPVNDDSGGDGGGDTGDNNGSGGDGGGDSGNNTGDNNGSGGDGGGDSGNNTGNNNGSGGDGGGDSGNNTGNNNGSGGDGGGDNTSEPGGDGSEPGPDGEDNTNNTGSDNTNNTGSAPITESGSMDITTDTSDVDVMGM